VPEASLTPHGPGFSFIDEIVESSPEAGTLTAKKSLDPELPFFRDHFPGNPLMPGVLMVEAAAQAAGALIGAKRGEMNPAPFTLAQVSDFRLKRPVLPGQTLEISVTLDREFGQLCTFQARLNVEGSTVAGGSITLNTNGINPANQ